MASSVTRFGQSLQIYCAGPNRKYTLLNPREFEWGSLLRNIFEDHALSLPRQAIYTQDMRTRTYPYNEASSIPLEESFDEPAMLLQGDMLTPSTTRGLLMGEMGVTNSQAKQPILASFGARTCVIVAVYNPVNQRCALAHVDSMMNQALTLTQLLRLIDDREGETPISVWLASGEGKSALNSFYSIIYEYERFANLELKGIYYQYKSLGIDARTGDVFVNIDLKKIDLGEGVEERSKSLMRASMMSGMDEYYTPEMAFNGV